MSLASAAIFAGIFLITWDTPDKVYVNKGIADWKEDYFIIDEDMEWDKEESLFVGNMDEGERVYEVQGYIIIVEKVRGIVSSLLMGGAAGLFLSVLLQRKKRNVY